MFIICLNMRSRKSSDEILPWGFITLIPFSRLKEISDNNKKPINKELKLRKRNPEDMAQWQKY
ncbi:MAG: hypothetical protein KAJ20_00560 [Candidatus Aenigmarchaeota archaeon]|nr:hypothetical protein [Candidatus Aenigmarchaeota archaeon]